MSFRDHSSRNVKMLRSSGLDGVYACCASFRRADGVCGAHRLLPGSRQDDMLPSVNPSETHSTH